MSTQHDGTKLTLSRRDLAPGDVWQREIPGVAVLYVASGSVEVRGGERSESLDTNQAMLVNRSGRIEVEANEVDSTALMWDLHLRQLPESDGIVFGVQLETLSEGDLLIRCDRVDFPAGGEAMLHTHQGPGIRCLLSGTLHVRVGNESKRLTPMDAWFEAGPDPVHAVASAVEPTAFVRVMVLPRDLLGTPSIRYVREEDRTKPKSQRYTMFVDSPITWPEPSP